MMLLDSCTLLWLAVDQSRLSSSAKQALESMAGVLFISAISAFEIGTMLRRGALALPVREGFGPREWYAEALEFHGIRELPVSGVVALESTLLPLHHRDPGDRIIVATAREQSLRVVTPDPLIAAYEVDITW
jgi:PIN domain nuclease of toxin-antitoxin system